MNESVLKKRVVYAGDVHTELKKAGGPRQYYVECDSDCWTATGKYSTPEEAAEAWNKMEKDKHEILNSDRLRNLTDEELSEALYELQHRDDLQDPSDYLNWLLGTDWGLYVDN